MANIKYFSKVISSYLEPATDHSCLFCGCVESDIIGKKYFFLQLRKCKKCGLLYRYPKDKISDSVNFYQSDYKEGFTTKFPSQEYLKNLLDRNFIGSPKDISKKINLINSYVPKGHVLDYGCSWGYSIWQFKNAGYEATGFEISKPRAKFGIDKLNIEIIDDLHRYDALPPESFEIIFSSHVLEHLTDISKTFQRFYKLLKENGILALFVPDCDGCDVSDVFNQKKSYAFGEKHTIAYTSDFLSKALKSIGFTIISIENTQQFGFPELVTLAQKNY